MEPVSQLNIGPIRFAKTVMLSARWSLSWTSRCAKKHLELSMRVSGGVPQTVVGDPTRLRQLIVNLVGNAIKFTEEGYILVDAEIENTPSDGVHLHTRVSDSGIGIPLEKQRIIFES